MDDPNIRHNKTDIEIEVDKRLLKSDKEVKPPKEPVFKDVRNQIIASLITSLIVVQVGLNMSYSAILLPQLEDKDSGYSITKVESSWIASLLVLVTPIGSLLSGPIADKIGRKKTNVIASIPMFIAWILFVVSPGNNLYGIYVARILGGLAGGLSTVFIVYVSEICHEKYRPMVLGLNSSAVSLGILIVTGCGVYLHWRTMAICFATIALITLILTLFTPESPHWLAVLSKSSDYKVKTEKALKWLNPNAEIYQIKLKQVLDSKRRFEISNSTTHTIKETFLTRIETNFKKFTDRGTLTPVIILMGLILLQQMSGGYSIVFYTIHIFKKIGGNFGGGINEYHASLMMGIIRFAMSIISAAISRILGRKSLLSISAFGMAASSIVLYFYDNYLGYIKYDFLPNNSSLINNEINVNITDQSFKLLLNDSLLLTENYDSASGNLFPMICILIFVCASSIGLLNVPWTMMGELLPTSTRGMGTGFLISFAYVIMFFTIKIYPFLLDSFRIGTLFFIHGVVCLVTILFTYVYVPETLGKSLNEIEKYFIKNK